MSGSAATLPRVFATLAVAAALLSAAPAHPQDESRRMRSGQVKVGDRILANPTGVGPMDTCTVLSIRDASGWRPGFDGDYAIKCDHNGWTSVPATGDHMQLIPAGTSPAAQARPQTPAATPPPQRTAQGPTTGPVQPAIANQPRLAAAGGNAFGSRNPRPCATSGGATPSTTVAAQLVACAREAQSRQNDEELVDNVRVTSMTPSRYDPHTQTGFTNMDTTVPPIAIRGSLQSWSCRQQDPPTVMAKYSNVGQNCTSSNENNATGYCYKLRTGSWTCNMNDTTLTINDRKFNVPPPR